MKRASYQKNIKLQNSSNSAFEVKTKQNKIIISHELVF